MIRALNCALFILVILLTAIFGLIALLIFATEQPDALFDKLYTSTTKSTTVKSTTKTTLLSTKAQTSENSTIILLPLSAKLKLTNTEKVMSIGLKDNDTFYAAKANGEIEFFNWTNLESFKTEDLDVPIHRIDFLSDGRLVATEIQNKTLRLFDRDYKVVVELKLGYQALDLRVFRDMIYVLSRINSTIYVYDNNLIETFKISWNKQNSCNFIQPAIEFVYVSCDTSILKISNEGKLIGKATIPNALYSLAVYYVPEMKQLWAVQRGKEEIHVFDENLEFQHKIMTENNENAVWSSIGFADERVFALDYVSNTIKFFTLKF